MRFTPTLSAACEQSLGHLDVARHSNLRVTLQRFTEQRFRFLAITCGGAIDQHHCVEATYLRLFEDVGQGLRLLHCDLKMPFSGFPLTACLRGVSRDRMRQAKDRPKHPRSNAEQLANQ